MRNTVLPIILCAVAIAAPVTAHAQSLSSYRDVALGSPVAVVVDQLNVSASDVKVVHQRPSLIQQLTWRPQRFISGSTVGPDPLAELILTFHLDRLVLIAVTYDKDMTKGLTNADLLEAFNGPYGRSMLVPVRYSVAASTEPEVIGRWDDSETLVLLWREAYPNRIALTIASIAAEPALREATADGVRLDASEAPARDLARREIEEAARRAREEKSRRDNKATFKP